MEKEILLLLCVIYVLNFVMVGFYLGRLSKLEETESNFKIVLTCIAYLLAGSISLYIYTVYWLSKQIISKIVIKNETSRNNKIK